MVVTGKEWQEVSRAGQHVQDCWTTSCTRFTSYPHSLSLPLHYSHTHTCVQHCQRSPTHRRHRTTAIALCDGALHSDGVREGFLGGDDGKQSTLCKLSVTELSSPCIFKGRQTPCLRKVCCTLKAAAQLPLHTTQTDLHSHTHLAPPHAPLHPHC